MSLPPMIGEFPPLGMLPSLPPPPGTPFPQHINGFPSSDGSLQGGPQGGPNGGPRGLQEGPARPYTPESPPVTNNSKTGRMIGRYS